MANINTNVPDVMEPGSYSSFDYYAGPNGLPANIQKILLIGDACSGGTLAVNKPTAVYGELDVAGLAGRGSVLHQMYVACKKAWKYAQITILRHAAPVGSPAEWSFTLSGTATKAGAVSVVCNGIAYSVGVAKNAAYGAVAKDLADLIKATSDAPFTAEATLDDETPTGEVVLTAKCKGEYITANGGLNVSVSIATDGINTTSVEVTDGVGTVDIEAALASAFPERFHLIVPPVADAVNLGKLRDHLRAAAEPLEQRGQRGISSVVVDSATTAIGLATGLNFERLHIGAVKKSIPSCAWEIASAMAAIFASNSKPNIPMDGDHLPGIGIPDVGNKWNGDEREALMRGGVIPLTEEDGELAMVRAVTTKSMENGVRFEKLVDTGVIATLDYFRDSIKANHAVKFKKKVVHGLMPDAVNEENIKVANDLERDELLRNVAKYEDLFECQEDTKAPGRLLCRIPAPVVPGLHQIFNVIELYL